MQLERHGLGGAIPVVSGLIDMRPEVVSIHWPVVREVPVARSAPAAPAAGDDEAEEASPFDGGPSLARLNLIQRGRLVVEQEDAAPTGSVLRRRLETANEAEAEEAEAPGLMRRLLGRG